MRNSYLTKIYVLFWKNLILLKRQYIVTAFQILLPTLFVIIFAYNNIYPLPRYNYESTGSEPVRGQVKFENENTEEDMVSKLSETLGKVCHNGVIIGYVPNTDVVLNLLRNMVDDAFLINPPSSCSDKKKVNFRGFDSEEKLEDFQSREDGDRFGESPSRFAFGIVFEEKEITKIGTYKIRLPQSEQQQYTDYIKGSPFGGIQLLLDKALVQHFTGKEPKYKISLQKFSTSNTYYPHEETPQNSRFDNIVLFLSMFIVVGFLFVIPTVVRGVVSEKATGIKELMKMAGLSEWMHWFGWVINSLTTSLITVTIITMVLFTINSGHGPLFKHSDPTLLWVILMVYTAWATTYCFAVSAFFERPALATTVGILIWVSSVAFIVTTLSNKNDFSLGAKLMYCLVPNAGIYFTLNEYCLLEAADYKKGAKWGNMATFTGPGSMTLFYPFLMMFVSMLLNMIICLYVGAVLPKKYGIRKPIYFIFQPSEWGLVRKPAKVTNEEQFKANNADKPGIEDDTSGSEVGIKIVKLFKKFGKGKVAVNDLSVDIFKGQIFCLLGENGAGKTTTMSILTGLFSPTSGTAFINGLDIRTNMANIRDNLGLCPQHDMLFDKMTVVEHLKFFGMLRGLSSTQAEAEAVYLLQALRIPEKKTVLAKKLEADVLGDRIAIMASGELQCCGSTNYLKRFYGAGFILSMTIQGSADREMILNAIRNHIADAYFKVSHSNTETELSVVLPSDSSTTSSFPALFSELTKKQTDLGIDEIGVGWTTMDEVFVKVEELRYSQHVNESDNVNNQNSMDAGSKPGNVKGFQLLISQFYGLLMKKIILTTRKNRSLLFQMLTPILLTIAVVAINKSLYRTRSQPGAIKFTLSSYDKPVTLYSSIESGIGKAYAATVGSSAKPIDKKFNNVSDALFAVGRNDISYFQKRHIIAAEINATHMKAMYSDIATQTAPLSVNIMTNTMLREAVGEGFKVEIIDHPFGNLENELDIHIFESDKYSVSGNAGFLIPIGIALLAAGFISAPTDERLCKGKQLQIMTGVDPMLYWGVTFICDYLLVVIIICMMTACLPIFEINKTFTNNGGAGVFFLIMAVYGIAALAFTYVFSTFVRSNSGGFNLLITIHLLTGVFGLISVVLDIAYPEGNAAAVINVLGRLFPTFGLTKGVVIFTYFSSSNSKCYALSQKAINLVCSPYFKSESLNVQVAQECCENCQELGNGNCFKREGYLKWSRQVPARVEKENYGYGYDRFYTKIVDVPSVGQDLFFLALMAVIYFAILAMIEYGVFKMAMKSLQSNATKFLRTVSDTDVLEESNRIRNLVGQGRTSEDAIVVENLCKSYGNFSAVSSLSFGVHHGECFGLLGVNGAGKTTTFRMLTGDENRSYGNSYLENSSLVHGKKTFLAKLGYCPQFEGFIGLLTGREMLTLYARLRGVPGNAVKKETANWLRKTGLIDSGNVQCEKYSGGMKRRLSAAMALIGDPHVILMDEPTSGVDPVARRQFWKIVTSIKNSGQAVILTSHSMDECEALGSRLGIMVNGEIQCFGGVQHLKNKFAQGYSLIIKLKAEHYQNIEMTNRIAQDVTDKFSPCDLKDHHQTTMKFQIHSQQRSWEDLYGTMEGIKENNQECIEEYAITETTLEEVFLAFARTQHAERLTTGGNCMCC